MKQTRRMMPALFSIAAFFMFPALLMAQPTQEEVLKSISRNVEQPFDLTKLAGAGCALVGVLILLAMAQGRKSRKSNPKPMNHAGKLTKEIAKVMNLKPIELKKLKAFAEQVSTRVQEPLVSPLILILCPSLLGGAIKEANKG